MVRVARLERAASTSQMWRPTNWATPGYSVFAIIPRRAVKIKFFLSVVIYVVKGDFVPLSAIGENPANAGVARLCGVSTCPVPDSATALPKQARYQLRYTRILTFCHYNIPKRVFLVFVVCEYSCSLTGISKMIYNRRSAATASASGAFGVR